MGEDERERERRHQDCLERINRVQLVVGRGDRARVDHEGTLLERARLLQEELCAHHASEAGLAAYERLLCIAEGGQSRQARDVAAFLLALWMRRPLPLDVLRGLPRATGDDMLAVLDAWRWARLELHEQVAGGAARVARALRRWQALA